jgi:hypothetical protein
MKKIFLFVTACCVYLHLAAQHSRSFGLAFSNNHTAIPFSKFSALATGRLHPGVEIGGGFNWQTKARHDWYQAVKLGYMFHHLVQHGISLYTQGGYRLKLGQSLQAEAALGLGYLYSIPATQVFKLGAAGAYENTTGMGRHQAMAAVDAGLGYVLNPQVRRPLKVFITYQQRIQAPFVRSFMSVLPYNTLLLGSSLLF